MSAFLKSLFATPILVGQSDDRQMAREISELAYQFKANAKEALLVSSAWNQQKRSSDRSDFDKDGVTSYATHAGLFTRPEWAKAGQFIQQLAHTMLATVDHAGRQLRFGGMWTTIYPQGAFIPMHTHPNSILSGVFYALAEEGCGGIEFQDPNWIARTMHMHPDPRSFPSTPTKHIEEAVTGKMVIFPAWLPHSSLPNESGADRIIVSFNMEFQDRPG